MSVNDMCLVQPCIRKGRTGGELLASRLQLFSSCKDKESDEEWCLQGGGPENR